MLAGSLRTGTGRATWRVIGFVTVTVLAAVACVALMRLRAPEDALGVVAVLAGSALTLGFLAGPLLAGVADPLDPRRFRTLGLEPAPLAGSLVAVGMLSVPVLALAAPAFTLAVAWSTRGVPLPIGIVSAVLAVVTCSLGARVSLAVSSHLLRGRRSRELTGLLVVAVLVVALPAASFLAAAGWSGESAARLGLIADLLADTPLGAAWAIPLRWSAGATGPLGWSIAMALVTVAALGGAWVMLVARMLSGSRRPVSARGTGGLGWFTVTPGTPAGAVAARSLLYWLTDRRYILNVVIIPVAAVLVTLPLLLVGVPLRWVVLIPVPLMALFLGWLPHNDLAYDSTALWLHVATGLRGVSDRCGRLVPIVVIGVPLLAVGGSLAIVLHGRWAVGPALAGVCASLFLVGLGLSSIASALAPYPVPKPGDGAFRQPQRSGASGVGIQALVMGGTLLLSAPALWWGWLTLTRDISYAQAALVGGLVVGVVVLLGGVWTGAAVFDRRGPRLLEVAESV